MPHTIKKLAKLVTFEITTRIVCDDSMDDETIAEIALPQAISALQNDGCLDHLQIGRDGIVEDTEVPFMALSLDEHQYRMNLKIK